MEKIELRSGEDHHKDELELKGELKPMSILVPDVKAVSCETWSLLPEAEYTPDPGVRGTEDKWRKVGLSHAMKLNLQIRVNVWEL